MAILPLILSLPSHTPSYTTEVDWTSGDVRLAGNAGNRVLYSHAEWFAAHGIAALFYDKRGVGESTGHFRTAGFDQSDRWRSR